MLSQGYMPAMFRIELRTVWWIIAGLFFAGGVVQLFVGNLLFMELLDLVNERLPNESQISQIGANRRAFESLRLYRQLYPHGPFVPRPLVPYRWLPLFRRSNADCFSEWIGPTAPKNGIWGK